MSLDKDIDDLRGMVRMLSDRVADIEARLAMMTAAMTMPASTPPDDDQPTIIHDVAPNAPR